MQRKQADPSSDYSYCIFILQPGLSHLRRSPNCRSCARWGRRLQAQPRQFPSKLMKWRITHIQQPLTPQSICLHAPMQYIFNSSRVKLLNHTVKYNNLDTAVVCAKQLHQQAICNDNCFARITQLEDNDTEPRLKFNAKSVPGCHSRSKSSNVTAWLSAYLACL